MEKTENNKKTIYVIGFILILFLIGGLYYGDLSNKALKQEEDYEYVTKLFDGDVRTVVSTPLLVRRPYNNADVKILQGFYDYKADETAQENAIINYESTYMQNNGVIYGGIEEAFDVVSILDGKVVSVKDDKILGKVVTIEHENNITSIYQSLSEVTVKEGDQVSAATVIGKAGVSNLEKDLGNHLLIEVTINGNYVNPEQIYDKQVSDLKSN